MLSVTVHSRWKKEQLIQTMIYEVSENTNVCHIKYKHSVSDEDDYGRKTINKDD